MSRDYYWKKDPLSYSSKCITKKYTFSCIHQTNFYIYYMSISLQHRRSLETKQDIIHNQVSKKSFFASKNSMLLAALLTLWSLQNINPQALKYKLMGKTSQELTDTLQKNSIVYKPNIFTDYKQLFDSAIVDTTTISEKKDSIDPYKNFDPDVSWPALKNIPKEKTTVVEKDDFFKQLSRWVGPKDPLENAKKWNDTRNEKYPKLSPQEKQELEAHLRKFTIRSAILSTKPIMKNVSYIAVHSTGTTSPAVVDYLQKTGKVHFEIDEEGNIRTFLAPGRTQLSQQNHLGEGFAPVSCASWNGDHQVTFKTIWIEVRVWPAKKRNEKQYAAVRKLLSYLMEEYKLTKRALITHTMVAYNPSRWLMRKYDPYDLDREKLGVPPASDQINVDVVEGKVAPNMISMYRWLRKPTKWDDQGPALSHYDAINYLRKHYDWVNNAIALHKQRNGWKVWARAHLANNPQARLTIDEIDKFMRTYVAPAVVEKTAPKKAPAKKAKHSVSKKRYTPQKKRTPQKK